MSVTLTLRAPLTDTLDLDGLTPDAVASRTTSEIAALPVWLGGRAATVGDLFRIDGATSTDLRLVGDLSRANGVGAGMSSGVPTSQGPERTERRHHRAIPAHRRTRIPL